MPKTRFMKVYQLLLLPLYLFCCIWLFVNYVIAYGIPDFAKLSFPIAITMLLTDITYVIYTVFLLFLLLNFGKRTGKIFTLNTVMLFTFPMLLSISTITTNVILYEIGYPTNVTPLSYVLVYALEFCILFLPQLIYFKKRKHLFGEKSNTDSLL